MSTFWFFATLLEFTFIVIPLSFKTSLQSLFPLFVDKSEQYSKRVVAYYFAALWSFFTWAVVQFQLIALRLKDNNFDSQVIVSTVLTFLTQFLVLKAATPLIVRGKKYWLSKGDFT